MAVKPEVFEAVKKAIDLLTSQKDSDFALKKVEGRGWAVYTTGKLIRADIRIDDEEEEEDAEG